MNKYTFLKTTNQIELYSINPIKPRLLNDLNDFINFINNEYSNKKSGSLLDKFNKLDKGEELIAPKQFYNFIETTIEMAENCNKLIKYIKSDVEYDSVEDLVTFNSGLITKLNKFEVDSSISRIPFMVESLAYFITKNKIKDILIKSHNHYFGYGNKKWNLEIDFDEEVKISSNLQNGCISYFIKQKPKLLNKDEKKFFALKDKLFEGEYYLIFTKSPIEGRLVYELVKDEFTSFSIKRILKKYNAIVKLITFEKEEINI